MAITSHLRLEPRPHERNLAEGFAAPVQDPVWFLARQWQMGEHQGENASSPVWVDYRLTQRGIAAADPRFDPTVIPAEAILESELDDWWTLGRRVRIGQGFAGNAAVLADATLLFFNPPPPYEQFHGVPDGLQVWRKRAELGLAGAEFPDTVPPDSTPAWDSVELVYQQDETTSFSTSDERLTVQRHRGGRLDWHSVDASPLALPADPEGEAREAIPTQLHYPGAPNARWWQIEDAAVDLGGHAPDSAHSATAMLTELVFSHSDDWFLFPVTASAGHVVAIGLVQVRDSFGRTYDEADWPGLQPPEDWTLFKVDGTGPADPGLPDADLVLWHVAELPLESAPLERVQLGLDEQSNVLWAVERIVDGREVESRLVEIADGPKFNEGTPSGDARKAREYAYVPAQGIGPHWTPYTLDEEEGTPRRLVQRRLADLSRQKPSPMPAPQALVLQADGDSPHVVAPLAVPSNGVELTRRWQLARDMHGEPVLWLQRERGPLLSPPARTLRFDVMEESNLPEVEPEP